MTYLTTTTPKLLIAIALLLSPICLFPTTTKAQETIEIGRETANNYTIDIDLFNGRNSIIDFSRVNENITHIALADPSKTVYTTNKPLSGSRATAIFIKPIEELNFEGLTTAFITTLTITTQHQQTKDIRIYNFNLHHRGPWHQAQYNQNTNTSIAIAPTEPGLEQTISIGANREATLTEIERGLEIAIENQYTLPNDPIVFKLRQIIALARNGYSIDEAVRQIDISQQDAITALVQLGTIAKETQPDNPYITEVIENLYQEVENKREVYRRSEDSLLNNIQRPTETQP